MPKSPSQIRKIAEARATNLDAEVNDLVAAWEQFRDGFRRTARGSLCGEYAGHRVTVFKRRDPDADPDGAPRYGWVVETADGEKQWSPFDGYDTEDEALTAVRDELDG